MIDRKPISTLLGKTIVGIRMSSNGQAHEFLDTEGNVFLITNVVGTFDSEGNHMIDDSPCTSQLLVGSQDAANWATANGKPRKRNPEHPKG